MYLVVYDSGWVSLEHLLLSWYPYQEKFRLHLERLDREEDVVVDERDYLLAEPRREL